MRTLSVEISDIDFERFGLTKNKFAFADILELARRELTKENLMKAVELSEKYGISEITMSEITSEVKKVRNAKSNH